MTIQQEPGQDSGTTRQMRSVVPPISAHLPPPAATITAELPAVTGPRGRAAVPAHRPRRRPAPVAIRIFVWLLVLVLTVVAAGTIVARVRPDTLSALRSTATTGAGSSTTPSTTAASGAATLHALSATTYQVSSPTFAIVITVPGRCWIDEHSPAGSSTSPFAQTVPAGTTTLHVQGSASVITEAQVTSIEVTVNGKSAGSVPSPSENVTYTFESGSSN